MKIKGNWASRNISLGGHVLLPFDSQDLRNHSPDGFNWGYGGSGPAQLALAILLHTFGKEFAQRHYQDFKWQVVARWPQADFEVDFDLDEWRTRQEAGFNDRS